MVIPTEGLVNEHQQYAGETILPQRSAAIAANPTLWGGSQLPRRVFPDD